MKVRKFIFKHNDEEKVWVVPESLYQLSRASDILVGDDYNYRDEDVMSNPFNVTYDWLAQRCYEIAVPLFGLDVETTWVEFNSLSEADKRQGIVYCVRVIKV